VFPTEYEVIVCVLFFQGYTQNVRHKLCSTVPWWTHKPNNITGTFI